MKNSRIGVRLFFIRVSGNGTIGLTARITFVTLNLVSLRIKGWSNGTETEDTGC